ncbi:hypothetical protein D3C77_799290 [compost metagenome]
MALDHDVVGGGSVHFREMELTVLEGHHELIAILINDFDCLAQLEHHFGAPVSRDNFNPVGLKQKAYVYRHGDP